MNNSVDIFLGYWNSDMEDVEVDVYTDAETFKSCDGCSDEAYEYDQNLDTFYCLRHWKLKQAGMTRLQMVAAGEWEDPYRGLQDHVEKMLQSWNRWKKFDLK